MAILENIFKRDKETTKKGSIKSTTDEADTFDKLKYIDTLCTTSMSLHKSKLEEEKQLLKNIESLDQLKKYDDINPNDLSRIEELLAKYASLGKEKESLKSDLLLNEKKYEEFRKYEDSIEGIIKDIKELEVDKDKLDTDLKYLKAEQGALKFEEERIQVKFKTLEKVFYVVLFVACILVTLFSGLYFILGESIILPCTIVAVLIIFVIMWVFMLEGDLRIEFEKNKLKQEKIVKMINKIKIKIVNVEATLASYYKKYDINSSAALRNKWAIYRQTKNKRLQYNEVFTDYFDIYEQIDRILNKYSISFENELAVLKELSDTREKLRLKEETEREIIISKKKLERYENEQKEVLDKLNLFKDEDQTEEQTIAKLVDAYLEQLNKVDV